VIISNGVFLRFPLSPKATANTSITINSLALFYHEIGYFSNRAYTKREWDRNRSFVRILFRRPTSAQLSRAVKADEISLVEPTQPLRLAR